MSSSNELRPLQAVGAFQPSDCRFVVDAEQLSSDYAHYGSDESKLAPGSIASVALPQTIEQLSGVLAWHHARGHSVVVSGGRTGVVGGATAQAGAHVVSTERLVGFDLLRHDDRPAVRVKGGTPLRELTEGLDELCPEWFFPVDPTESSATIGGMVSTNASGTRSLRYGATRRWVQSLRVVLVDGRLLELRRGAVCAKHGVLLLHGADGVRTIDGVEIRKPQTKHAIGYSFGPDVDAVDLFVGAEGTLGVVAEVELRLSSRPAARIYHLQFLPDDEAAFALVDRLQASDGLHLAAIEYLDERSLNLLREKVPPSRSRFVGLIDDTCRAAIYTELELDDADGLEDALGLIVEHVEQVGGDTEHSATGVDDADWRAIKAFRHALPEQINAIIAARKRSLPQLHKVSTDMAVGAGDLRGIYAFYRDTLARHGLQFFIFGHAGNSHFHVNILPHNLAELELSLELYREFAQEVVRRGGAVAGEHGIGRLKRDFLHLQYSEQELQTMGRIKQAFDPRGLLGPGVLLPDDSVSLQGSSSSP